MKTKLLKLASIVTTSGTQIRAHLDVDAVEQYAEAMRDAATNKFPPVVVFHDGNEYVLADGFHRVMAASRNAFLDIEADVRKGTKADALRFALGANAAHGLRRTNADKRRSVELALAEWPKLSDRELGRICAVSDHFVGDVRKSNCEQIAVEPTTRIGADGKERRMPRPEEKMAETVSEEVVKVESSIPEKVSTMVETERHARELAKVEEVVPEQSAALQILEKLTLLIGSAESEEMFPGDQKVDRRGVCTRGCELLQQYANS